MFEVLCLVYAAIKNLYIEKIGLIKPLKLLSALLPFANLSPDVVELEITNACNLHCPMCGSRYMKRKWGFMSFTFYKKIVDQLVRKVQNLNLYSTGEPLLHKQLPDMIRYAKQKGIKDVSISTNATLLTEELSKKLIYAGLDTIQISVEGGSKREYEMIREGAKFESVRKNISNFIKIRGKKTKPKMVINLLVYKDTDIKNFFSTWKDFCDQILVSEMQPILTFDRRKKCVIPIYPSGIKLLDKSRKVIGCNLPFIMPVISYDGKVGMCCSDFEFVLQMGDAKKENILDIFNNRRYRRVRHLFVFKKFDKTHCRNCPEIYMSKQNRLLIAAQNQIDSWMNNIKKV